MKRRSSVLSLLSLALALAPAAARAEVVRTLHGELPAGSPVRVENLAGVLTAVPGSGSVVSVTVTVHAENDELASKFSLVRLTDGSPTLRVRYPDISRVRYPDPRRLDDDEGWSLTLFEGSRYEYDGRRYRVSRHGGELAWAEVRVELPASHGAATLAEVAGELRAENLSGDLSFSVRSADIALSHVSGNLKLNGTSGDIRADSIGGTWHSEFSSGDCRIDGFRGDRLDFETTSGDLTLSSIKADSLKASATSGDISGRDLELASFEYTASSGDLRLDRAVCKSFRTHTTSGDVRVYGAEIHDLSADASSGDVEAEFARSGLTSARIRTSSGDVRLDLPSNEPFVLESEHDSGSVSVDAPDSVRSESSDRSARYSRGEGGARIEVRTSSGDQRVHAR